MEVGISRLVGVIYGYGSVYEPEAMKNKHGIIPKSVCLMLNGEKLTPTQFDEDGCPQIGGIANLILIWRIRQLVRDGVFDSEYSATVQYQYETTTEPIVLSVSQRLPKLDICPVCGKNFKKIENVVEISGKNVWTHKSCSKEFYKLQIIDKTTMMVEAAFNNCTLPIKNEITWRNGLSYHLIPNEYCSQECCSHKPWFLFNTPLGDIKIGWRKRVISITWMENFKPFDMSIFDDENVTKYQTEGRRTIHAENYEKLFEYLSKVYGQVLSK